MPAEWACIVTCLLLDQASAFSPKLDHLMCTIKDLQRPMSAPTKIYRVGSTALTRSWRIGELHRIDFVDQVPNTQDFLEFLVVATLPRSSIR